MFGIGGIVGRIVARRDFGFLIGGLCGTVFGVMVGSVVFAILVDVLHPAVPPPESRLWRLVILAVPTALALIGVIAGGVFGGRMARKRTG